MKKLLTILLVLMLTLSMGSALATETSDPASVKNGGSFAISKDYTITNDGTTFPGETITFEVTGDTPAVTIGSVAVGSNGHADIVIQLPTYTRVGTYTYTIQEKAGSTAGVDYDTSEYTLTVTVVNGEEEGTFVCYPTVKGTDGDKLGNGIWEGIVNTYSAGSLSISKTVEGNMGDKTQYFTFTVTLTPEEGKTYEDAYSVSGGSYDENPTEVKVDGNGYTFHLKDGDTITIENLPYGVGYTVTEAEADTDGYVTTVTGDTGKVDSAAKTAAFTNTKGVEISTGITTDNLPYIVLMGLVVLAGVAMIAKRRMTHNH